MQKIILVHAPCIDLIHIPINLMKISPTITELWGVQECLQMDGWMNREMDSARPLYGPRRDKTCLWGFRQSKFQTSLLSYRD